MLGGEDNVKICYKLVCASQDCPSETEVASSTLKSIMMTVILLPCQY